MGGRLSERFLVLKVYRGRVDLALLEAKTFDAVVGPLEFGLCSSEGSGMIDMMVKTADGETILVRLERPTEGVEVVKP